MSYLLIYLKAWMWLLSRRKSFLSFQDSKDKIRCWVFYPWQCISQALPDWVIKEYPCLISTLGLMINTVVGYYFYSSVQSPRELNDSSGLHYVNKASCVTSVASLMKWLDQTVSEVPAIPKPKTIWWMRDS